MSAEALGVAWALDGISGPEKAVAVTVAWLCREEHGHTCFPSNEFLVRRSCFSLSTVRRAMDSLVEREILYREQRLDPTGRQTSNLYGFTALRAGTGGGSEGASEGAPKGEGVRATPSPPGGVSERAGEGVRENRGGCQSDTPGGVRVTPYKESVKRMSTKDADEAVRAREQAGEQPAAGYLEQMRSWIQHPAARDAAMDFARATRDGESWARAFWSEFGPDGGMVTEKLRTKVEDPDEWRAGVSAALLTYTSEKEPGEWYQPFFLAILGKSIRDSRKEDGVARAGTEHARAAAGPSERMKVQTQVRRAPADLEAAGKILERLERARAKRAGGGG